jgi:RNA polymerase sigma factor (sigma-70 family)
METWKNKTTTALLDGLKRESDSKAWSELNDRVHPIVLAMARRSGLDEQSAADVAQETLMAFLKLYKEGRYDRGRGRLGHWIMGIARNSIHRIRRSSKPQECRLETVVTQEIEGDDAFQAIWEEESRSAMLTSAFNHLETKTDTDPITIKAFRRVSIDGAEAKAVAAELNITTNSVYLATNRCLKQLRQIVEQLDATWELHV